MKTYKINENCALKLRTIMTDDVLTIIHLVKDLDIEKEGRTILDFVIDTMESGAIDELAKIALEGDFPEGKPGSWLPLETALEVAEDFLASNKMLAKRLQPHLKRFNQATPESPQSLKVDTKTTPEPEAPIKNK